MACVKNSLKKTSCYVRCYVRCYVVVMYLLCSCCVVGLGSGSSCLPGASPTGPGAQNRYFLFSFLYKSDTFPLPAAPRRLPRPAPALKIVMFYLTFFTKTILFRSRPVPAGCPDPSRRSKSIFDLTVNLKFLYPLIY